MSLHWSLWGSWVSISLSESQESLVVSTSLMNPHWSALVSDYNEAPLVPWVSNSLSQSLEIPSVSISLSESHEYPVVYLSLMGHQYSLWVSWVSSSLSESE